MSERFICTILGVLRLSHGQATGIVSILLDSKAWDHVVS